MNAHEWNESIICPYCGHHFHDSGEVLFPQVIEGSTELQCGECDRDFIANKHCLIRYSTEQKIEPK